MKCFSHCSSTYKLRFWSHNKPRLSTWNNSARHWKTIQSLILLRLFFIFLLNWSTNSTISLFVSEWASVIRPKLPWVYFCVECISHLFFIRMHGILLTKNQQHRYVVYMCDTSEYMCLWGQLCSDDLPCWLVASSGHDAPIVCMCVLLFSTDCKRYSFPVNKHNFIFV